MQTTIKTCLKCHCAKPLDEFYRHKMMRDGRLNKCIDCARKDAVENRKRRLLYYREYDLARAKESKRKQALIEKAQHRRRQFPEKTRAHSAVARALRSGLLTKQPCVICGHDRVVAHHESYDRPLDVVWLCHAHHAQYHVGQLSLPQAPNSLPTKQR